MSSLRCPPPTRASLDPRKAVVALWRHLWTVTVAGLSSILKGGVTGLRALGLRCCPFCLCSKELWQMTTTSVGHFWCVLASQRHLASAHVVCRAGLVFDPYKAYGGVIAGAEELSYVDIIINPLLAALNEVLTKDTKVRTAVMGLGA